MSNNVVIAFEGQPEPLLQSIDAATAGMLGFSATGISELNALSTSIISASSDFTVMQGSLDVAAAELMDLSGTAAEAGGATSAAGAAGVNAFEPVSSSADGADSELQELLQRLQEARAGLIDTGSASDTAGAGLGKFALVTAGVTAAIGAVVIAGKAAKSMFSTLVGVGVESVGLWREQESQVRKLNAVLEATGNVTGFTSEQLQNYASHLQSVTTTGDETILGVQKLIATFKNVRGDEFLRATELSLDMAEIMGGDATSAATQLAKALQDPLSGITALSRAGVQFSAAQKDAMKAMIEAGDVAGAQGIILDELDGQFGGAARTAAGTFGGSMQQLSNRLGDVKERIGQLIEQGLALLTPHLEGAMTAVENATTALIAGAQQFSEYGTVISAVIDVAKAAIIDGLVYSYVVLEEAIVNSGKWMEWWANITALTAVRMGNDFAHTLTVQIPAYINWLGENWFNILKDMSSFSESVTTSIFTNFKNVFMAIYSWIKGDGFDFQWTGLLEGFESTVKKLPKIAEREVGAIEAALLGTVGKLDGELSNSFADRLATRRQQLDDLFKPAAGAEADFTHNALPVDAAQFAIEGKLVVDPAVEDDETEDERAGKGKGEKELASATEGAESLYQRIADASAAGSIPEERWHNEQIAVLENIAGAIAPEGKQGEEQADTQLQATEDLGKKMDQFIALAQSVARALPLRGTLA